MGEWKTTTIGEIAEVYDGPHATPPKTQSGPWFLSISSLDNGRLNLAESAHISEADFERWTRRVTPREGDVLFSYETRLGEAALMPAGLRACLGRRMGLLRPKPDRVDSRFLLYAYLGPEFQEVIRQRAVHGATVDRIPLTELPNWPISIPSLREQRAIAAVLGALDEKIAANEQTANSCDKLAEALLDQLLAEDPEVKKISLGEVAKVNPRTVKPVAGGYLRYIDISCVSAGRIDWPERLSWDKAPGRARRGVSPGDTIWSTVRPGRRSYALILDKDPEIVVSTGFVVLTPVKVGPAFLYEIVKRDAFVQYLENVAEGSAYPAVRPERFASAIIPLPSAYTLQRFEDAVMPLRSRAHAADQESRTLAQLRDTLLPKLMSGELRVRDAEKAVEEAL